MKSLIYTFSVCALFFCFGNIYAQDYNFRNIGINEGLPSGRVHAITQGENGLMYFATNDGLVRYDGERMKVYHHKTDSNSIPVNKVKALLTDKNGNIWCAHDKLGVSIFNTVTEEFQTIRFEKFTASKTFSGSIINLTEGIDGKIYASSVFSNEGLFIIDPSNLKVEQFLPTAFDVHHLLNETNNNITECRFYNDTLWLIGTLRGLLFYNPVKKIVSKVLKIDDTSNQSWENYISGIVIDTKANFYYGAWHGGLHYYDFKKQSTETYKTVDGFANLEVNAPKCFINDSTIVVCAWELMYFNTNSKKITRSRPDVLNKYSFIGRSSDAYRAADGSVWMSTLTGVSFFNPQKNDFKTKILYKPDEWLNENPKSELFWITYDRASHTYVLNYRDLKATTNSFYLSVYDEQFKHLYDVSHPLKNEVAAFLYAGSTNSKLIFSGTKSGMQKILMFDLLSKKITEPFLNYQFPDSIIFNGLYVNYDTLYVVALNKNRILKFNIQTYQLIDEVTIQQENEFVSEQVNRCLKFDVFRNIFWIDSEQGIFKLFAENGQIVKLQNDSINKLMMPGNKINAIGIDSKNKLWFALQNGLIHYDPENNVVLKWLDEKALPSLNTYSLYSDSSGYIWSDCSKGMMRIDPDNYVIQLFNSNNGLQPLTYPGFSELTCNGNLIIPFAGGLVLYDTRKRDSEIKPFIPVITSLKIFEKEFEADSSITQLKSITLPFQNNSITFEFAALNYSSASFTQYEYKLKGLDVKYTFTQTPSATYTNLEPGVYLFHLRSSWDGKQWSDEQTLEIIITPPWHRTGWFRALIILISVSLILFGYKYRIAQISKEEKLKAEFKNRLMEMEMTALRSQMNPHFIFNSLNSINRYVMQNDRLTASEYIAKFGKLIRNVLDNSRSETISLQAELSTLELYIQLEKLRFEDKFEYRIIVSDDVDTSSIKIPPMLIQPFVENSIWHGLMHKEDKGIVIIEAEMKSKTLLKISIEDNGIGRAKAAELKSKNTGHNSHGLKVTTERIKIINEIYKQENKIEVIDLYDDNKNASGTRVVLLIPAQ